MSPEVMKSVTIMGVISVLGLAGYLGVRSGLKGSSPEQASQSVLSSEMAQLPFYAAKPLLVHDGKEIFVNDLSPAMQTQARFVIDSYRQQMESIALDVAVAISLSESGVKPSNLQPLIELLGDKAKPSNAEIQDFVSKSKLSFPPTMSAEAVRMNSERMLAHQKVALERNKIRSSAEFNQNFIITFARPKAASTTETPAPAAK